jgi:hypothetical protein
LIFDLAWAAALVWLGHHRRIRPWGLFALYVAGYSAYRIFEETIRIDSSEHFLGLRLNFYVATIMALIGIAWFVRAQRGPDAPVRPAAAAVPPETAGAITAPEENLGAGEAEPAHHAAEAPDPDGAVTPGSVPDR